MRNFCGAEIDATRFTVPCEAVCPTTSESPADVVPFAMQTRVVVLQLKPVEKVQVPGTPLIDATKGCAGGSAGVLGG